MFECTQQTLNAFFFPSRTANRRSCVHLRNIHTKLSKCNNITRVEYSPDVALTSLGSQIIRLDTALFMFHVVKFQFQRCISHSSGSLRDETRHRMYLRAHKSWREDQLNLAYGTEQRKIRKKLKIGYLRRNSWRAGPWRHQLDHIRLHEYYTLAWLKTISHLCY